MIGYAELLFLVELSDVPLPIGGWDEGLVVKEGWGMMGGGGV